jgi:hypothetical protein
MITHQGQMTTRNPGMPPPPAPIARLALPSCGRMTPVTANGEQRQQGGTDGRAEALHRS